MTCEKLKIKIFRDIIKVNIGAKGCDYDEPRQSGLLRERGGVARGRQRETAVAAMLHGGCWCRGKRPIVAVLMAFAMCLRIDVRDGDDGNVGVAWRGSAP